MVLHRRFIGNAASRVGRGESITLHMLTKNNKTIIATVCGMQGLKAIQGVRQA